MNKQLLRSVVGSLVLVLFVFLVGWYVFDNWEEFNKITIEHPILLIPAVLFLTLNIYAAGIVIDLAMEPHGIKLTKSEAFGLANITRFSNQFSPTYVGATLRAAYMKRVHHISFTKFSSSFLVSNLLQLMVSGVVGVVILFTILPSFDSAYILGVLCMVILIFLLILYTPLSPIIRFLQGKEYLYGNDSYRSKLYSRFNDFLVSYIAVKRYPGLLLRTIFYILLITISLGIVYFSLYRLLGYNIEFSSSLLISSLTSWSVLVSLTPGNIGVREGLMVLIAQIVGAPLTITLLVAFLLRIITLIISGVFAVYYMPRMLNKSLFRL